MLAACLATAAAALGAACGRGDEPPRAPEPAPRVAEAEPEAEADVSGPAVVFRPAGRPEARVAVEVARTQRQTQRGLMYREHLPPDAGMLFLFARPKVQSFWMKNTLIPLDIIFVSSEMVVVGVVENAEPSTTKSRTVPGVVSQFVVEVNAGWAREHGIAAGVPVEFVGVEPLAPGEGG
jgi:uncharacterized protein